MTIFLFVLIVLAFILTTVTRNAPGCRFEPLKTKLTEESARTDAELKYWEGRRSYYQSLRLPPADENLEVLGLTSVPESLETLRSARRKAIFLAHPDRGGSAASAQKINLAYEKLIKGFQ